MVMEGLTLRCFKRFKMKRTNITAMVLMVAAFAAGPMRAQNDYDSYDKFRVGGYGEVLAKFMTYGNNRWSEANGASYENRNTVSVPRFVLAFDYKFTSKWILSAEIEFESGGTGVAYELEDNENYEYEVEVEKGGEVELEQIHITRLIVPEFNVRVGHVIVPVGLTNAHHEPINFFGTSRPEGESTIIPSTWHETGLELFGSFGKEWYTFDYQVLVVAGLNGNAFSKHAWAGEADASLLEEDHFTSPGYAARIDYRGIPGLRVGASYYFCNNVLANCDKGSEFNDVYGAARLHICSVDAQYTNKYVTFRGNCLFGNLGNSYNVSKAVNGYSSTSPYSKKAPIAKRAVSYGAELGFNLQALTCARCPVLYPFARYEYYNPQEEVVSRETYTADNRAEVSMWTAGLNWKALPNLVFKADYTTRKIGGGDFHHENEFAIGLAYIGWFWGK